MARALGGAAVCDHLPNDGTSRRPSAGVCMRGSLAGAQVRPPWGSRAAGTPAAPA